jgi:hypothetical protein
VQIFLGVLPVTFASGGLTAGLYSERQERRVLAVTASAMLVGTMAVVAGAVTMGAEGAAVGVLLKQLLLAALLGGLTRWPRWRHEAPSRTDRVTPDEAASY